MKLNNSVQTSGFVEMTTTIETNSCSTNTTSHSAVDCPQKSKKMSCSGLLEQRGDDLM